jgi:transposase
MYRSTPERKVIGRFEPSSKLHFQCGWRNDELGSSEVFYCPKCNETLDRDLNASLNIERLGVSLAS